MNNFCIENFNTIDEALEKYPGSYIAMRADGDCKVCGKYTDLRMGTCFTCADNVSGESVNGGHKLWQSDKPSNFWLVKDD